jgi:hypothetical protein
MVAVYKTVGHKQTAGSPGGRGCRAVNEVTHSSRANGHGPSAVDRFVDRRAR